MPTPYDGVVTIYLVRNRKILTVNVQTHRHFVTMHTDGALAHSEHSAKKCTGLKMWNELAFPLSNGLCRDVAAEVRAVEMDFFHGCIGGGLG